MIKQSQQLMYNNAIAVFGIVPMLALCFLYGTESKEAELQYCKNALVSFKGDVAFRAIVEKNLAVVNGSKPVMVNDLNVYDIALKDLGYFESYNQIRLDSEVQALINFLDIGV